MANILQDPEINIWKVIPQDRLSRRHIAERVNVLDTPNAEESRGAVGKCPEQNIAFGNTLGPDTGPRRIRILEAKR